MSDTTRVLESFDIESSRLLNGSNADNTNIAYKQALQCFDTFRTRYNIPLCWPPPLLQITRFVGFLSLNGYSPSTIRLYISGLSFKLKVEANYDITKSFVVQKMISGSHRLYKVKDVRQPITFDILQKLNSSLKYICSSRYETIMFQCAFSLAYAAFLRVSEITITNNVSIDHVISINDVFIDSVNNQLFVYIKFSKTDQTGKSTTLVIQTNSVNDVCPIHTLRAFLCIRPQISGPLFCHLNGNALTRFQFHSVLKKTLQFSDLDVKAYNTHSFRIGAATSAYMAGKSDDEIKCMGRWSSTSFQRYVRISFN